MAEQNEGDRDRDRDRGAGETQTPQDIKQDIKRRWDDLDKSAAGGLGRMLPPDRVFIAEVTVSITEQRRAPGPGGQVVGTNVAKEVGQFVVESPERTVALTGIGNEVFYWASVMAQRGERGR